MPRPSLGVDESRGRQDSGLALIPRRRQYAAAIAWEGKGGRLEDEATRRLATGKAERAQLSGKSHRPGIKSERSLGK